MMHPILALCIATGLLAGCAQPSRTRPTAAASAACRAETDRIYAAQNRAELSFRDQRDTPFAAGYNSGITTRGLGARFGRDNLESSCLANAAGGAQAAPAGTDAGTGPTFQPATR